MSWTPPDRPDWVLAINRGEILPMTEVAERPFSRDDLLAEAAAAQGLDAPAAAIDALYGHVAHPAPALLENLDRLTQALEEEAQLSLLGRFLARRFLLRLLEVRLQILAALRSDPGLAEEKIRAPLIVAGAPRTGTTILYEFLNLDDRLRAPRGWELLRPVPSPSPSSSPSHEAPDNAEQAARIQLAERELVAPQTVVDGIRTIHAYGARQPKECLSAMSFALQSEEFTARYRVPSYAKWLERSDMTPAYNMHRLVLQILQRRSPETHWVLKSPVHLHSLDTLFATYPDARVAITHRDPLSFLGSLGSLIANLRWAHSDHVDVDEIRKTHHARYAKTLLEVSSGFRDGRFPSNQMHHSLFRDFIESPGDVVEGVYAKFGMPLAPALRDKFSAHPAAQKKGPSVPHQYARHIVGNDATATRRDFETYQATFSVPDEGPEAPSTD